MYCTRKVTEDVTFVGGNDRRLSLFEGVYEVPNGVSYNSYLLMDEQTVLFDTVDSSVSKVFFENLEHTLNGRKLDYIVVQHMEPDHSATLAELLLRYPEITVICGPRAEKMLRQFTNADFQSSTESIREAGALSNESAEEPSKRDNCSSRLLIKNEGETLITGRHTLQFFAAPMVHWPEVIVTYDTTDKILFSADAFGTFGSQNGAIFADEVDFDRDYMAEARRYYCNIVGKYGTQVQALLAKAAGLQIEMICPLHGFVWRKNISDYLEKYDKWSSFTPERLGVVVAYASVYGNTANAADILACRLRDRGIETLVFDVSVTPASTIIAAVFEYSHLIFASTTYNAGIFVRMDELLRDLTAHGIRNRVVGFIENGTWAPTSGRLMKDILSGCKDMTFLEEEVTIHSALKASQSSELDALVNTLTSSIHSMNKEKEDAKIAEETAHAKNVDPTALFKLSYGLFVVTAKEDGKDNGCIINTATQITNEPNRIAITINKKNLTHDMILKTGDFNLSVLSEEAPFKVYEHFGFQSGRNTDKFENYESQNQSENGLLYLTKCSSALISGKVFATMDCGTHTLFLADVTEAKILSEAAPATYAYYFEHVKPKPPKKTGTGRIFVCKICGYIYDEDAEGIRFEDLPDNWVCPLCKHPKSDFELQQ